MNLQINYKYMRVLSFVKMLLIFLVYFLVSSKLSAVEVKLQVSPATFGVDEQSTLVVAVSDVQSIDTLPQLLNMDSFKAINHGQSSRLSIVNNKMTSQVIYTYSLAATQTGSFAIGPAEISVNGKSYKSERVVVTVVKGSSQNSQQGKGLKQQNWRNSGSQGSSIDDQLEEMQRQMQEQMRRVFDDGMSTDEEDSFDQGANDNNSNPSKSKDPSVEVGKDFYVDVSLSDSNVVVGETSLYTVKVYRRVQVAGEQLSSPDFKGIPSEVLGEQKNYRQTINGSTWLVTEFNYALMPSSVGNFEITSPEYSGFIYTGASRRNSFGFGYDSFFDSFRSKKPIKTSGKKLQLTVMSLPRPIPSNFINVTLSNDIKITSSLSKSTIQNGESVTLSLTFSGEGNLKTLNLPDLKIDGFKIYNDKPEYKQNIQNGKIYGEKVFKFALLPLSEGNHKIPSQEYSYFNGSSKNYKTIFSNAFELNVLPGVQKEDMYHVTGQVPGQLGDNQNSSPDSSAKKSIALLAEDIMQIKRDGSIFDRENFAADRTNSFKKYSLSEKLFFIFSIFIMPAFFGIIFFLANKNDTSAADIKRRRQKNAYRQFNKRIKKLSLKSDDVLEQFALTYKLYLGDKFNIDGIAITPVDIPRLFEEKASGVQSELIIEAKKVLSELEASIYSAFDQHQNKREVELFKKNLLERLISVVRQLDREAL